MVILLLMSLTVQTQTHVPSSMWIEFVPGLTYEGPNGASFAESEIEAYHLYCDGAYVRDYPNDFTRRVLVTVEMLGAGNHTCRLSETVGGMESIVSETAMTFDLGQRQPTAPTLTGVVPGA